MTHNTIKMLWTEATGSSWPSPGERTVGEYDYILEKFAQLITEHHSSINSLLPAPAQSSAMRLMLGPTGLGQPSLLVDVMSDYDPSNFNFFVVNGLWYGSFHDGDIRVNDKYNHDVVANCEILCSDQDRLRGNYDDVFNNFHNVNYCAPVPVTHPVTFDDMDDDIPF